MARQVNRRRNAQQGIQVGTSYTSLSPLSNFFQPTNDGEEGEDKITMA